MASINDNLFTIMNTLALSKIRDSRILTKCGPMTAQICEQGIKQLYFDTQLWRDSKPKAVYGAAFLELLANYKSLTPAARWKYLALEGTPFQLSVWKVLNQIPFGTTVSYQYIAKKIGKPKANRAVGTAVGTNPISILIPCHRVIQGSGALGNYRWGVDRKRALLDAEQKEGSDLLQLFT